MNRVEVRLGNQRRWKYKETDEDGRIRCFWRRSTVIRTTNLQTQFITDFCTL